MGLYPEYKTKEKLRVVNFPKYPSVQTPWKFNQKKWTWKSDHNETGEISLLGDALVVLWSSVIANQSQEENRTILENSVSKSMLWKLCSWSISVSVWGVYRWFVGKLWVHLKDIWFCTFVSCIFDTQVDNMTPRWYIIIEGSPQGLECRSLRKKKQTNFVFVCLQQKHVWYFVPFTCWTP